ncbi:hypothetical protein HPB48_013288 [Haemaphysalis longicornis]|uniref:Uncharacterized protein n=1 Tax=Haemaphysalis longicornis TaxID=44386 RepID=A0A9J6GK68_HAELO|nr:hypothetical protein HPB48_013288 [Haemaphysalis longicornis]
MFTNCVHDLQGPTSVTQHQEKRMAGRREVLFGPLSPSYGHVKRVTSIILSELRRQVRLLTDFLCVNSTSQFAFQGHLTMVRHSTEVIWMNWYIPLIKQKWVHQETLIETRVPIQVVGDMHVSDKTTRLLERGPEFAVEPALDNADKVALVRLVAEKAPEAQKARIIREGVDYLTRHRDEATKKQGFGASVRELREKNLKICVSDKQGRYRCAGCRVLRRKADEAMGKNFVPIDPVKLKESKQDIVSLLAKENLDSLFGKVKGTKNGCLQVFYAAKDHNPGIPFRAIVSESGTWQAQVSHFLAKHLARIEVRGPFIIANSRDVFPYLEGDHGRSVSGFRWTSRISITLYPTSN